MVTRFDRIVAVVSQARQVGRLDVEDAVGPRGNARLGARVVRIRVQIKLVCGPKVQRRLDKLLEDQAGFHAHSIGMAMRIKSADQTQQGAYLS